MDKAKFTEISERLKEVNQVIEKLDPAIRVQAFQILVPYVSDKPSVKNADVDSASNSPGDAEEFFAKYNHDKPADNAFALAAYWYSQYGSEELSVGEMRDLASSVGVTIPDRVDVTYDGAKRDGKSLFQRMGKGRYKPTVHGEAYFKKTYEVVKGKNKKPDAEV